VAQVCHRCRFALGEHQCGATFGLTSDRSSMAQKGKSDSRTWGAMPPVGVALALAAVGLKVCVLPKLDIMKGLSNDAIIEPWMVQVAISAFCLTPGVPDQFMAEGKKGDSHFDPTVDGDVIEDFLKTGEVREDDYEKASIYALLYGLYNEVGRIPFANGSSYEFTFNTWGIHNPDDRPYGPDEPQRHGKAAYNKLVSSFDAIQELMELRPNNSISFLEIGCGTGAGAHLVSSEVWPNLKVYNALDMQAGAIRKCKAWANPKLNCVHSNGQTLPFPDNSQDVIVISETHIAEMSIGDEEKAIFAEMKRVLKEGGYFVWGNALPTKVWFDGADYLTQNGWTLKQEFNHTDSAVIARDEDNARVDQILSHINSRFPVFKLPYVGNKCRQVLEPVLRNFFRDVGTDLYLRMVTKHDSYMHQCYQLHGK